MLAYVMCGLIIDLIMDFCGDEITRGPREERERLECLQYMSQA